MANFVTLTLDTTSPIGNGVALNGGSLFSAVQLVNATISTTDTPTTGYQMKIFGNVDLAYNANIQATEETSTWITYNPTLQVKLSAGDGVKSVSVKLRDDVLNESVVATQTITLDTSIPVVTVSAPDVAKISKVATKNTAVFTFSADSDFVAYTVRACEEASTHGQGTEIGTTGASINTSGSGAFPASTPITVTITGADLDEATEGDGAKIVKVFVQDTSGNWSV